MTCREKILSENYQDFISGYLLPETVSENADGDVFCAQQVSERLWSVYYNRALLPPLSFSDYNYRYVTELYGLMDAFVPETVDQRFDPQPLLHSGILAAQREPLTLTGRNVILGFADTGIDYQNPVFRRADGSSRIRAIWDQTIQTGTPPEGFFYGSEYTNAQINRALETENPLEMVPVTDEIGHGTAMASAAAGSELNGGLDFAGAAPDAELVVVKLKPAKQFLRSFYMLPDEVPAYELNDILLAVKYLLSFREVYRNPLVVCLGIGRSFGGHQGETVLEQYLSDISREVNSVAVVAGGNEGNTAHHFSAAAGEREMIEAELRITEGTRGLLMEIWGNVPDPYEVSILSPAGEVTPALSSRLNGQWEYEFIYGNTRLRLDFQRNDQVTGNEVTVLRLEDPVPGIWTIRLRQDGRNGQGTFLLWLPVQQFLDGTAEFLMPDPDDTLTAPSYASAVLSVTAYDSRNDSFLISSGRGFGLGGRKKPELAAPGSDISAAVGKLGDRTLVGNVTGSSMAAAIAAGACAQLMQWAVTDGNYQDINGVGIKSFLVRGTAREENIRYPNPQWGFGRLDLEGTFEWIAGR